ncbi:helix-turn-helix domain-containing protein [Halomonas sp. E14]|uniref:helix-turn-helix domain-containing protein n=1 Tax=Halomonas sp. E14 TaxID=3397245 RepID=UPI00403E59EE
MPRPDSEEEEKRIIWERILETALRHHRRTKVYGMQKVISADTGPEGSAGYVGTAAVSKWAKGKSKPERETLRKLSDLYGVSMAYLSGREGAPSGEGQYGPPDELLRQAGDITELVVSELLPNGTADQFLWVMRRAHDLLLEGMEEKAARGELVLEVARKKREWQAASNDSTGPKAVD